MVLAEADQRWEAQKRGVEERETVVAVLAMALLLLLCVGTIVAEGPNKLTEATLDTGATAWMLASTALVLFMTPGLAFFYGGMVDRKSILYCMFQSISAMALVTVVWIFIGFSLAFGEDIGGVIGNPYTYLAYRKVGAEPDPSLAPGIPLGLFSLFQLKFCIISGPIVSGAFTERIALGPYLLYLVLFSVAIYAPLAHAVWHPQGFLKTWGVIDYAGGLVVETATGYAALAGAYIFNHQEPGHHEDNVNANPHIPFIVLGTSLLWFGWFGFNSGSALKADGLAMQSFLNTQAAASTAIIAWLLMDKIAKKKPGITSACIGAVVGLVCITPACGFVNTGGAFMTGAVGAIICNVGCRVVKQSKVVEDQLEVWPAHGLGGTVGTILTGLLADPHVNPAGRGLVHGGYVTFYKNLVAAAGVALYAFVTSYLLFRLIGLFLDLKVPMDARRAGLDVSFHGETIVFMGEEAEEIVEGMTRTQLRRKAHVMAQLSRNKSLDSTVERDESEHKVDVEMVALGLDH